MRLKSFVAGALVLAALAYLALRTPAGNDARQLRTDFLAMGTLVSISVVPAANDPPERVHKVLAGVENALHEFERTWSPWGDGLLGDVNRTLADGSSFRLTGSIVELFLRAEEVRRVSGGVFDARIGALVRLWGFDDEAHFRSTPPEPDAIGALTENLRRAPGFRAGETYGPASDVQWDFGGIAKGLAVELAMQQLKEAGIANAIVNAGGNLRVAGRRGDRPWRIGIRQPRAASAIEVLAALESHGDEAVITSGDYERFFEFEGVRYHHILDPRSGWPARGLQAVTVVHPDAALADAASTALFVAGPEHWRETARVLGIEQAMVVLEDDTVQVTEALAPRLKFVDGVDVLTVP
jgi:FAD:protein FMN transferase